MNSDHGAGPGDDAGVGGDLTAGDVGGPGAGGAGRGGGGGGYTVSPVNWDSHA